MFVSLLFGVAVMNEHNLFIDEIGHLPDVRYCFNIKFILYTFAHTLRSNLYVQLWSVNTLIYRIELDVRPTAAIKL